MDIPRVICWNVMTRDDFVLPLPSQCFPDAIACFGQVLYVGGRVKEDSPILGLYDLTQSPQWTYIQLPSEVDRWGKSIDALLIDGLRLIAIDDLVTPCWVLVFDISEPLQPKISTVERFEEHGTYEHVSGASAGHQWIAVLTKTMSGWSGLAQHISIMDKSSLKEQAIISAHKWYSKEDPYNWSDLVFWDDLLLVAAGKDGIGILDLSKKDNSTVNSETCKKDFYCISLPSFHDGKIVRIIPAAVADYLGVVLQQENNLQSLLLHRQDLLDFQNTTRRVPFESIDREPGIPRPTQN